MCERQIYIVLPYRQHWGSCLGGILLPISDMPGTNRTRRKCQKLAKRVELNQDVQYIRLEPDRGNESFIYSRYNLYPTNTLF